MTLLCWLGWNVCTSWSILINHNMKKQWSQCSTEYYSRCEKEKKTATQKINFCTTQVVKTKRNDTKINKKDTKIHRMKTKWWHLFACVQYFTGPWLLYVKNKTRLGNLASVFCEPSHTWWQIYHCCMSYWSGMKEHISIDAESQWPLNRSEYFLPQAVGVSSCCGC